MARSKRIQVDSIPYERQTARQRREADPTRWAQRSHTNRAMKRSQSAHARTVAGQVEAIRSALRDGGKMARAKRERLHRMLREGEARMVGTYRPIASLEGWE